MFVFVFSLAKRMSCANRRIQFPYSLSRRAVIPCPVPTELRHTFVAERKRRTAIEQGKVGGSCKARSEKGRERRKRRELTLSLSPCVFLCVCSRMPVTNRPFTETQTWTQIQQQSAKQAEMGKHEPGRATHSNGMVSQGAPLSHCQSSRINRIGRVSCEECAFLVTFTHPFLASLEEATPPSIFSVIVSSLRFFTIFACHPIGRKRAEGKKAAFHSGTW